MTNKWIIHFRPRPQAALRLFCFACAGGSAQSFVPLLQSVPDAIEVCPVELPGRGLRLREPAFHNIPDLVEALLAHLSSYFDRPFAFFGHSMGALVAFELTRSLRRAKKTLPLQLFVSAHHAPQVENPDSITHTLSDEDLLAKVRRLGGTPPEVLQEPDLLNLILPTIKADFEALDTYRYTPEPPLPCPIMACGGLSDLIVSREQVQAWREQTTARFTLQMFPGGHFFLQSAAPLFMGVLNRALDELLKKEIEQ